MRRPVGDYGVENLKFQLPPKRCNVFCILESVRQPVPEGGRSIEE